MKISIITACLNSASTLGGTIDSVVAQNYGHVEHIIKDGGSKDETSKVVRDRTWSALRFLSRKDTGVYDAMNQGLSLASGEVVGFLNADDFLADSNVISRVARLFEETAADVVYGDIDMVDPKDIRRVTRKWKSGEFRPGKFREGWQPPHPACYVRREVLLEAGGFDPRYSISADYALMMKLMEVMRCRVTYDPSVWVKMRAGGNSNGSLRNILKGNLECRSAMIELGIKPPLTFPMSKLWSKVRQRAP